MHILTSAQIDPGLVANMRITAAAGIWRGSLDEENQAGYFHRCQQVHIPTGTYLIFTRDEGYHTSGWWKNPDYERCLHLTLSFFDPNGGVNAALPKNESLSRKWILAFFNDNAKYLWCEPPAMPEAQGHQIWHYRLFCDKDWNPIKPRGEVYSTDFTEKGFLSYSDLHYAEKRKKKKEKR